MRLSSDTHPSAGLETVGLVRAVLCERAHTQFLEVIKMTENMSKVM